MKRVFIVLLLISQRSFGQQNQIPPINQGTEIKSGENISFISQDDFAHFSQEELDNLHGNYILFEGELTKELAESLIVQFNNANKTNQSTEYSLKPEEQQFVKEWLSVHPDVKIVKRSEYLASPENIQNEYTKSACMILLGEIVTREDILNY